MGGRPSSRASPLSLRIGIVAVASTTAVACSGGKPAPRVTVTYEGCSLEASSLNMQVNVANPNSIPLVISIEGSFNYDGTSYRGGSQLALGARQSERWQVSTGVSGPTSSGYSCKVTAVRVSTT